MTGTPVYLVRHAKAEDRAGWVGRDDLRPLTEAGRRQAAGLVAAFAGETFAQLLSSPFVRCVQTLAPLAQARGLVVETRDELAEGMPWEYAEKIVHEAAARGVAAVCVHGDVMRDLLGDLAERGIPLEGDAAEYAKGATWILVVADGVIVSGRYLEPPAG